MPAPVPIVVSTQPSSARSTLDATQVTDIMTALDTALAGLVTLPTGKTFAANVLKFAVTVNSGGTGTADFLIS